MIYLLNGFDLEIIGWVAQQNEYLQLDLYETREAKVRGWIENERTRTIMDRQEVLNLFNVREKVQIGKVTKIMVERYDKIIIWTPMGRYFVFRVRGIGNPKKDAYETF